jgi:hypothetical protein
MNLTLKLGQIVAPEFLAGFRKLRTLALPCAYELAVCAGTIDLQVRAYEEARAATIQRLGEPMRVEDKDGFKVKAEHLPTFAKEMQELEAKPVELPVTKKLKLGLPNAQLCADDLIPLLDLVEP